MIFIRYQTVPKNNPATIPTYDPSTIFSGDNIAPTMGKIGIGEGNRQSTKQKPKTQTRLYGSIAIHSPNKNPGPRQGTGEDEPGRGQD
jgi:hypothetical protein